MFLLVAYFNKFSYFWQEKTATEVTGNFPCQAFKITYVNSLQTRLQKCLFSAGMVFKHYNKLNDGDYARFSMD